MQYSLKSGGTKYDFKRVKVHYLVPPQVIEMPERALSTDNYIL